MVFRQALAENVLVCLHRISAIQRQNGVLFRFRINNLMLIILRHGDIYI